MKGDIEMKLLSNPEKLLEGDSLGDLKAISKSGMLPIQGLVELMTSATENWQEKEEISKCSLNKFVNDELMHGP